ncbi:hypothetical protein BN946_scf184496.g6 [Trametes cinnabarina]|uniref:Uncharacterized protein n=1 Tax=Pycnoporus cinnabarinus TaxID=5643 RepID=A0A060S894_PYCCI|nr:hypothetical protein BN946_scf184496.g6 [Trametes cinnabarina]
MRGNSFCYAQQVGSGKNLTKKQLEALFEELQREIGALTNVTARGLSCTLNPAAQTEAETSLETAHETIRGQVEALNNARAEVAAAEEGANAARAQAAAAEEVRDALQVQLNQVEAAAGGDQAGAAANPIIPLIDRPTGSGWSIREAMEVNRADYAEIQRTIRSLVIRSQLDWTDDFRRQDADKLANMFRAYMQNKRKHAYKQGYIKKRPSAMDGDNQRRDDDDDAMGGAGAGSMGVGVGA